MRQGKFQVFIFVISAHIKRVETHAIECLYVINYVVGFGDACYNFLIGSRSKSIKVGDNCKDLTFGDSCYSLAFGDNSNPSQMSGSCTYPQMSGSCIHPQMSVSSNYPQMSVCCNYPQISWLGNRSEEHTSELQSPLIISYAVFCLKKKK